MYANLISRYRNEGTWYFAMGWTEPLVYGELESEVSIDKVTDDEC